MRREENKEEYEMRGERWKQGIRDGKRTEALKGSEKERGGGNWNKRGREMTVMKG